MWPTFFALARARAGGVDVAQALLPAAPALLSALAGVARHRCGSLPRCLDAVRDLAGELIVAHTGSTDGTPSIAAARNCALARADLFVGVYHLLHKPDLARARAGGVI